MPLFSGNLDFHYDGESSKDFGVISVQIGNGMYEDELVSGRSVNAVKFRNQEKVHLQNIEEGVREFPLVLAFEKKFTDLQLSKLVKWLFKDYYSPFYFDAEPNRIVYAMPNGDSSITHNGLKQGYITITMTTNSSKVYSDTKVSEKLIVSGATTKRLVINNTGHEDILPEISILKNGAGKITIVNLNDNDGAIFELKNLINGESIYLDSEKEIVETDAMGVYHYEDTLGEYPQLVTGENKWEVTGDCEIQVRYKEKFKF